MGKRLGALVEIDSRGRVVIPKAFRVELGLVRRQMVELWVGQGSFEIRAKKAKAGTSKELTPYDATEDSDVFQTNEDVADFEKLYQAEKKKQKAK